MNSSKQKWLEILQKARLFDHLSIKEIEVLAEAMFYSEFEAGRLSFMKVNRVMNFLSL